MDLVYATGPRAQDAAELLLDDHDATLLVDELLSFASMRNGVAIRVTCTTQRNAQFTICSSRFVCDLTKRTAELLLNDTSDVIELIELLWS